MSSIIVSNMQQKIKVNEDLEQLIEKVINVGLTNEGVKNDVEVSVVLTDDEHIQQLNKTYRSCDAPTDVLSFAMQENNKNDTLYLGDEAAQLLGDIVISLERAKLQAEEYGHSFEREVAYLAVHGILHLLGYNHEREDDKKIMRQKEEQILMEFDLVRG
ncbi:MAG TPA: rRNA maturation RNase YbeY [Thermoanaerobacterales bacterium]|jgi:probable rRNA maturation factor|nr:rRNA maturation RNase YbeY [Thermoanaerobacterales bacterium]